MILIQNVKIVVSGNETADAEVLVEGGAIKDVAPRIQPREGTELLDGGGGLLLPGLIDAHVHLREPGFEAKETVASGTRAAARGGFTTVMPMPNLRPAPDKPETVKDYINLLRRDGLVRTAPYACITEGQSGRTVVDMAALSDLGICAFSDDGLGVQSGEIMEQAMKRAAELDSIIAAHTEDDRLKNGGYVHQGSYAESKGWRGIPSACEYEQVRRDLELVRKTGCRYHVCHVSAEESVALIRKAKAEGLPVTAEVTPHHLILCDEDVKGPMEKMNPPLRGKEDRQALVEGLLDGTLDIIATDHAPHTLEEKSRGLEKAPFGIVGLETAFPLLYTELVRTGILTLEQLQRAMTEKPAEIFRFTDRGRLQPGMAADLTIVDTEAERIVEPKAFASKGKNTPFAGYILKGWPVLTMVDGKIVMDDRGKE